MCEKQRPWWKRQILKKPLHEGGEPRPLSRALIDLGPGWRRTCWSDCWRENDVCRRKLERSNRKECLSCFASEWEKVVNITLEMPETSIVLPEICSGEHGGAARIDAVSNQRLGVFGGLSHKKWSLHSFAPRQFVDTNWKSSVLVSRTQLLMLGARR